MFYAVRRGTTAVAAVLFAVAAWSATLPCDPELTARIPPREPRAPGGTAFIASVEHSSADDREVAAVAQILSGNIPRFLRALAPIVVSESLDERRAHVASATLCVMPDYLAIGSDDDFVRMPLNLRSATSIARALGFILPTPKLVDAIHEQAAFKLTPQPMPSGPEMVLPGYFLEHDYRIRAQELDEGVRDGALVAGHKKDVVLSNRLDERPGRLAIYGWQYPDGTSIQPLSTFHHAGYADYSHGIRLVSDVVTIDGRRSSAYDVLSDDQRARLLSGEGAIRNVRLFMNMATLDSHTARASEADSSRYSSEPSVLQQRKPK